MRGGIHVATAAGILYPAAARRVDKLLRMLVPLLSAEEAERPHWLLDMLHADLNLSSASHSVLHRTNTCIIMQVLAVGPVNVTFSFMFEYPRLRLSNASSC